MVLMVPPEIVPLILKNDWDLVIVRSGWDCWSVRRAEYKVKSLICQQVWSESQGGGHTTGQSQSRNLELYMLLSSTLGSRIEG
jgi:hypothetical protein